MIKKNTFEDFEGEIIRHTHTYEVGDRLGFGLGMVAVIAGIIALLFLMTSLITSCLTSSEYRFGHCINAPLAGETMDPVQCGIALDILEQGK